MQSYDVAFIPGDGVGTEVSDEAIAGYKGNIIGIHYFPP